MNITLEIGFRFLPPDEQIISFFLKNKMIGDHQATQSITEVDLLKHEPWQLPAMSVVQSTYQEWFFFYKLNKISQRKNDRSTNDGFWKSTGADRPIGNGDKVIGYKKTLVFYRGRTPHGTKTDWVMHEFRADPEFVPPNADNSYVVGYLRNNSVEKTENSILNIGQPSTPFAGSSSQGNELGVASMEVAHQTESDMNYAKALQIREEEGIFSDDLSPSSGVHDHQLHGDINGNDQSRIVEEEGISWEDLGFMQTDDLVDEEIEFMDSLFHERPNVEAERMLRSGTDPIRDNAWDNSYVVGYLRNNSVEKTENSISNIGQPSTPFAGSSSQGNELGVASMEVAHRTESDMDYAMALQIMEEEGIFSDDLSPSSGVHDHQSHGDINGNDQSRIVEEEEGMSWEDLGFMQTDDLVDEEKNEWQLSFDTIDEEIEFMDSLFHERPNVEAERMLRSGTDPIRDNAWCDQIDGTGGGHSKGLHQKRMETGVHHDDTLLMDSGVESGTVTAYEINSLESVKEERSVNSRACKYQYEPRSRESAVQRHPIRRELQGKSLGKAVTRNKTSEGRVRSPVTRPVRNNKSNKDAKTDGDENTKLVSSSKESAGSSRKKSFDSAEISEQRCDCKPSPPLVYVVNAIVGLVLFIVVVRNMLF